MEGSLKIDLESYNFMTENLLTPKGSFYQLLSSQFPFLLINKNLEKSIDVMNQLVHKLIEKSKQKLKKNQC